MSETSASPHRLRPTRLAAGALSIGSALLWLSVVELALHTIRLPRLTRLLGVELAVDECVPAPVPEARLATWEHRQLRGLSLVSRHWPFGTGPCLRQALVAGRVLRRHHPRLRLGATSTGGELAAHAWIEVDGLGVLGGRQGYLPLVRA